MTLTESAKSLLAIAREQYGKLSKDELAHAWDQEGRVVEDALDLPTAEQRHAQTAVVEACKAKLLMISLLLSRCRTSLPGVVLDLIAEAPAPAAAEPKAPRVKRRKDGAA